jgi:branched-chain amino acid transport system substrate-binding protein
MRARAPAAVDRRRFLQTAAAVVAVAVGEMGSTACAAVGMGSVVPRPRAAAGPVRVGALLASDPLDARLNPSTLDGLQLYLESVRYTAAGRAVEVVPPLEAPLSAEEANALARRLLAAADLDFLLATTAGPLRLLGAAALSPAAPVVLLADAGVAGDTPAPAGAFRLGFTWWQLGYPLGEWVYYNLARRVYVTAVDTPYGRAWAASFIRGYAHAGVAIVGESYVPPGTVDFGPELARVRRARPEAVAACYVGADALAFMRQYAASGLKRVARLVGPGFLASEALLPAAADAAVGTITALHWVLTRDAPENARFRAAFRARYGREPDVFALHGYDAGRVLVESVERAGGALADRRRLREAVAGGQFESPRGPFRFEPATRAPVQTVYVRDVKREQTALANVVLEALPAPRSPTG